MRGRRIPYSEAELAFIEARRSMPRRAIRAAFVEAFARDDVRVEDITSLCKRRRWSTARAAWPPEQDELLRELYPDTPTDVVARRLGRALQATYRRAQLLGLAKSAAFMASVASGRLQSGAEAGAAHRFAKGHVPANKGLRRPGWSAGRMRDSQFRKGTRTGDSARKWKPIGSERIHGGYRWTKVTDIQGAPWTVNWKATHVLRWEQLHGPVPAGKALKSLDANRLNADPANWELVPRALLPRLNGGRRRRLGYDAAPAELRPTIMAVARLEHAAAERKRTGGRVA